jgi:hypothetical protein
VILGAYTQQPGGTLEIELGGLTFPTPGSVPAGHYSNVFAFSAFLQGTLDLETCRDFNLADGESFDIFTTSPFGTVVNDTTALVFNGQSCAAKASHVYRCDFGSFFDVFTEVETAPFLGGARELLINAQVVQSATNVPEPSSLQLLGSGLGLLALRRSARSTPRGAPPV